MVPYQCAGRSRQLIVLLFILRLFYSPLIIGWRGYSFYYINWLSLHLAQISIILYWFVLYNESNITLISLRRVTVFLSLLIFRRIDILIFYIRFELLMFPILLIIYFYGRQPEKISSIYYIILYTRVFSYPLLYQIIKLEGWLVSYYLSPIQQWLLIGAFLAKAPIFGLHYWLPKAHVEAPTSARILLAGVLLKVGIYGLIKILTFINLINIIIIILTFVGVIIASLLTSICVESKIIVAYRSVTHINLGLYGLNLFTNITIRGNYILSVSHGYIRALIFIIVGNIYKYNGTRILYYFNSMLAFSGLITFYFSILIFRNAGIPPLLSFWSEILLVLTLISNVVLNILFLFFRFILSFYYSIYILIHFLKTGSLLRMRNSSIILLIIGVILLLNLLSILL